MFRGALLVGCLLFSMNLGFAQRSQNVGLRDAIGVGLLAGAPSALALDVRAIEMHRVGAGVTAFFGAGVASWGIGESYGAALRVENVATEDGDNDALLIVPSVGWATMLGESERGFINFAPHETVNSIFAECGLHWIHEYSGCSLDISLTPGEALGVNGKDSGGDNGRGQYSFQLHAGLLLRFWSQQ